MVADELRLDIDGINTKMGAEMHTKPQTVQKRAGAQHAIMAGELSRDVGERIGRIGDGDIDRSVLFQKSQPTLRVATVGGAAGFFR